jgi:hypothetical protein
MSHCGHTARQRRASGALSDLKIVTRSKSAPSKIDLWRVANLMLKRYSDEAEVESAIRAEELTADGDSAGAAVWRRVTGAVGQLVNMTPSGTDAVNGAMTPY